jgi:hypothetical protein
LREIVVIFVGEKKEVLPPAAKAVAKSQRMLEFPVSSGNAHRYSSLSGNKLYLDSARGYTDI